VVKKYWKDVVIVILFALSLEWWQSRNMVKGQVPEDLSEPLPLIEGGMASLWQKDQTTLLYVFAPWCAVCKGSADNLNHLMGGKLNVVSVALSWETQDDIRKFISEAELEIPVLVGNDRIGEGLKVGVYPSYFLIGPGGEIIKAWSGYTTTAGLWLRAMYAFLRV
jgi:peroxiredoxin